MRTAGADAGKSGRPVVPALIATAFAQETTETAKQPWRNEADQARHRSSIRLESQRARFFSAPQSSEARPSASHKTGRSVTTSVFCSTHS